MSCELSSTGGLTKCSSPSSDILSWCCACLTPMRSRHESGRRGPDPDEMAWPFCKPIMFGRCRTQHRSRTLVRGPIGHVPLAVHVHDQHLPGLLVVAGDRRYMRPDMILKPEGGEALLHHRGEFGEGDAALAFSDFPAGVADLCQEESRRDDPFFREHTRGRTEVRWPRRVAPSGPISATNEYRTWLVHASSDTDSTRHC